MNFSRYTTQQRMQILNLLYFYGEHNLKVTLHKFYKDINVVMKWKI